MSPRRLFLAIIWAGLTTGLCALVAALGWMAGTVLVFGLDYSLVSPLALSDGEPRPIFWGFVGAILGLLVGGLIAIRGSSPWLAVLGMVFGAVGMALVNPSTANFLPDYDLLTWAIIGSLTGAGGGAVHVLLRRPKDSEQQQNLVMKGALTGAALGVIPVALASVAHLEQQVGVALVASRAARRMALIVHIVLATTILAFSTGAGALVGYLLTKEPGCPHS